MGLEDIENTEMPENGAKETLGMSISTLESLNADLMPKIRFTTDPEEAEAARNADRSNPLDLPDVVFYVGPKDTDGVPEVDADTGIPRLTRDANGSVDVTGIPRFQNDLFVDTESVIALAREEERRAAASDGGSYVGPSVEELDFKIEEAVKSLTRAQINLEAAIANGSGVMSAQSVVESAQAVVDALLHQHEEAVKFRGVE